MPEPFSNILSKIDPKELACNPKGFFIVPRLTTLQITGNDSDNFLQSQFINDIKNMDNMDCQFNAWCDHTGRVLAVFLLVRYTPGDYLLIMPNDLVTFIVERLQKYILRADVTIKNINEEYYLFGTCNDQTLGSKLREQPSLVIANTDFTRIKLPTPKDSRALLLIKPDHIKALIQGQPLYQETAWQWLDIQFGTPWITDVNKEKFLPQSLNLDYLASISLNKGCYPGQEVIARLHYKGKVKQRLMRGQVSGNIKVADSLISEESNHKVGTVISICEDMSSETHFLAVTDLTYENNLSLIGQHSVKMELPAY